MVNIYFKKPELEFFPFVGEKSFLFFPLGTKTFIEWQIDQLKKEDKVIETLLLDEEFFKLNNEEIMELTEKLSLKIVFVTVNDKRIDSALNGYEVEINETKFSLKYPWDFLKLHEFIIKSIQPKNEGEVEKFVTIKGNVVIRKNVLIKSGTYIEGPVLIESDSIIGPNCYLRPGTYLGEKTYIGNAVEIKNSVILSGTHVGHLSYVGDSIIGEKCNFGAGTLVANLKFDNSNIKMMINNEKINTKRRKLGVIMADNTKTSINLSIMPGTYITKGSRLLTKDRISKS